MASTEIKRLNEELQAALTHMERLNRELAASGDRAMRQHEGDRREVNDLVQRLKNVQAEHQAIAIDSEQKVLWNLYIWTAIDVWCCCRLLSCLKH